jgi:hypothetical protein
MFPLLRLIEASPVSKFNKMSDIPSRHHGTFRGIVTHRLNQLGVTTNASVWHHYQIVEGESSDAVTCEDDGSI